MRDLLRIQLKQAERLVYTVYAIASSPLVEEFVIGFTARPGWARRAEYRRRGYHHLAIIADGLTREAALDLERTLQAMVRTDRRWHLYRRYDPAGGTVATILPTVPATETRPRAATQCT